MLRLFEAMMVLYKYIQLKVKVQIQNQYQVSIYLNYYQMQTNARQIKYEIQD